MEIPHTWTIAGVAVKAEQAIKRVAIAAGISEELNRFNILYSKKHSNNGNKNNGNSYNNKGNSNKNSNTQPKQRVQNTREDADKYRDALKAKNVLNRVEKTGKHECYQFAEKCEHMGVQFKKGERISRDTMHHEWEYFSSKGIHKGAINPKTGEVYKGPVKGRTIDI